MHMLVTCIYIYIYILTAKLLLALASIVILGFESRGTHDHILLSHVSGSRATRSCIQVKVKVTLRTTTSRSVSSGFKAHVGLMTGYLFLLTFTSIVLSMSGAPSDERSGLSFVIVIVLSLLVNIYRFTCNAHVSYKYVQYEQVLCQSGLRTADE
jgi:hypothetical protein